MGKSKAPKPPDPKETSAASTGTNISTAIANSWLTNANQVTTDGSITYSQNGTRSITDPYTGQSYEVPLTTATTTLSPQQQAIKDQNDATQLNIGKVANNQSAFLNDYLGKPVELGNEAVESRLFDLGSKRLDPRFAREQEGLATKLSSQGIKLGSSAYDRAMSQFGETKNDAYNQLLLSGRGQAVQEQLAERNQPINEITALLSGSQVSMPQPAGFNGNPAATTDTAGIINNEYNQRLGIWNQEQQQMGSTLGGLFKLGGSFFL